MARAHLEAYVVAATLSGGPSTIWALAHGGDILEATRAAGLMFVPESAGPVALYGAAAAVHLSVSALWTAVLARMLPASRPYLGATLAAFAIAALDLGVVGRAFPSIRALALGPQLGDHLAFTWLVAFVLDRRGALAARDFTASR